MSRKEFVKVFTDLPDHPAWIDADLAALGLWVVCLTYCSRNRTDGHFPERAVARWGGTDELRAQLVAGGRWHEPGHDCPECPQPDAGRLYLHNYLDRDNGQTPRDRIEATSLARAEAGRRGGLARAKQVAKQTDDKSKQTSSQSKLEVEVEVEVETEKDLGADPGAATKNRASRARRLPDPFPITPELVEIGRKVAPTIDKLREHEKFCDYYRGTGKPMVDWVATWRNWMRRAQDGAGPAVAADDVAARRRDLLQRWRQPSPPFEIADDPKACVEWIAARRAEYLAEHGVSA